MCPYSFPVLLLALVYPYTHSSSPYIPLLALVYFYILYTHKLGGTPTM